MILIDPNWRTLMLLRTYGCHFFSLSIPQGKSVFFEHSSRKKCFLWAFLKEKVFSQKHNTISDVKNAIEREVSPITPSRLSKVWVTFEKRLQFCVASNGAHIPGIFITWEKNSFNSVSLVNNFLVSAFVWILVRFEIRVIDVKEHLISI